MSHVLNEGNTSGLRRGGIPGMPTQCALQLSRHDRQTAIGVTAKEHQKTGCWPWHSGNHHLPQKPPVVVSVVVVVMVVVVVCCSRVVVVGWGLDVLEKWRFRISS